MATQSLKFRKIKQEAEKSNAKPTIKTAAKLVASYGSLSKSAKKAAMGVIDKAYDMLSSEKGAARITTPFKELYAKFLREYRAGGSAKAAWKEGTSGTRDVPKDAGRDALKKGKRTVKLKGYTSNQYGRWKNKVGSTYYESRSNRMDVNIPVSKKKVKLAYGGTTQGEGVMVGGKMYTQQQINKMSADDLRKLVYNYFGETGEKFDEYYKRGGSVKKKVAAKKNVTTPMSIAQMMWAKNKKSLRQNMLTSVGYSEGVASDLSNEEWDSLEKGVHVNLATLFRAGRRKNYGTYAQGGLTEHGLKTGDKIVGKSGTYGAKIYNKQSRESGSVNLNSGKRIVNKYAKGGDC